MVSWSDNENWAVSLRRDYCGRVSDRFIPCQHRRPCPIHDREQVKAAPGAPASQESVRSRRGASPLPRPLEPS